MPPLTEHYSAYTEDVATLKRDKWDDDAATLLLALIDATEQESREQDVGVAPWYYEQLAIIRRKQHDLDGEIDVLEQFASQKHAPGSLPAKLSARLDQARQKRAASDGKRGEGES
jgi:hypothetical protein